MGLFTKNRTRVERHIIRLNEMFAKAGICNNAKIRFPVTELNVAGDHGVTTILLVFRGNRIHVTASYDKKLTYTGRDNAFQEFMRRNREPDKKKKEKWVYEIDVDRQEMIFTELYRMQNKITEADRRLKNFFDRIFSCVPQIFDTIQAKERR